MHKSAELRERFLIEAQAAAALSHQNICVMHEVGETEDRPYIAMEYVEGETLRDKIKKGLLKPEQALDFAIQIAAGLGEAHRKGIIHRDIKSANIMVTERGQAKVMDFGLAKLRGGSSLTKSQTTLGTVAYMSPEQARLASTRTVNPEAYDAYLKGSYHQQKLTPVDLDTAQRYFELALEKDPAYTLAYAGLAWIWTSRQQMGIASPHETGPKVKAAALRAVSLDDHSAGAHEALGVVKTWTDWDWAGAEPEWRRALELNPNSAQTHAFYSHFLANVGRIDEAAPHIELALKLDPFNALFHSLYASVLMYSRRYDDALASARTALAMQPDAPVALTNLDEALFAMGMREEQLASQRERVAGDPVRVAAFEHGLAEAGYEGVQRRLADFMAARYEQSGRVMAVDIAIKYIFAGDKARAIDWLEKAYEDRDPNLPYLGKPVWDSVRDDPRFQDLSRRMGLPLGDKT
ncbi:MAG: protein kinase [Candidatus Aminicenantales bacterium]